MIAPTAILASAPISHSAVGLLVILAAAAIVAAVFRKANLQTITGFVVAGALVGPNAWGLVKESESIEQISGLATMLLLFGIGLQLDVNAIRRGMVSILTIGAGSTAATALVLWPVCSTLGLSAPGGLAAGLALSLSSTAVLIRVLLERRELNQTHGRLTLGISIVQDLAAIVILSSMPILAMWGGDANGPSRSIGAESGRAVIGVGIVAIMLVAGRYLLPRVMKFAASAGGVRHGGGSTELVLVFSAAIAVGAAILTGMGGLSPELGAFIAGFILGSTPFRHQLVGQYAPLRDLLMAVFFTSVGLKVDPSNLLRDWWQIGVGAAAIIGLKTVVIGFSAWAVGASPRVATLTGFYLGNAGEFSFVVLAAAVASGVIPDQAQASIIASVVLTLMISPALFNPSHALGQKLANARMAPWARGTSLSASEPAPVKSPRGTRVVVAGFGPIGRHLVDRFTRAGMSVTLIDLNPSTVHVQTKLGRPVVFGDVTNPEVLESAGIREAEVFIVTIPDEEAMLRACTLARSMNPRIFIGARANYLSRGLLARQAGADHVTVEELATAEVMERQVMDVLTLGVHRSDHGA